MKINKNIFGHYGANKNLEGDHESIPLTIWCERKIRLNNDRINTSAISESEWICHYFMLQNMHI